MLQWIRIIALALGAWLTTPVLADASFSYKLTEADNTSTEKTISIAGLFARIEQTGDTGSYLLYQAGKFFPLYRVDPTAGTYSLLTEPARPFLTPPKQGQPAGTAKTGGKEPVGDGEEQPPRPGTEDDAAASNTSDAKSVPAASASHPSPASQGSSRTAQHPKLKATRKSLRVNGIPCRVILEMDNGEPAVEHCMANAARLKVTEREVITLARTFTMARARQLGWLGIGSEDEKFVSIRSRDLRDNRTLELKSVSTAPQPVGYQRIPREYKQLEK